MHFAGCAYYFPPAEIFSGEPLLTGDYAQRYLESVRVAQYLHRGSFLGYCTTWSAGFVDGVGGLINNKPLGVLLLLLPPALHPIAFNVAVFLALWLFPPLVHAAARRFGHGRSQAAAAMALAMACWYGSMMCRVFWRGGSVLFFVGTGAALWAAAVLFARWNDEAERPTALLVILAVVLVPWLHAGAVVVLAIMGGLAYALTIRSRGLRASEIALVAGVALVANLPWLWPFIAVRHLQRSLDYGIYPGGLENLVFDFVRGPLHLGVGPREETVILAPLVVLAALGAARLRPRAPLAPLLALSAIAFAALAYGGRTLGMGATQPYRFVIPLAAVLSITAGGALDWFRDPRRLHRIGAIVASSLALLVVADRIRIAGRAGDYFGAGLGETESWALGELRAAAAPRGGRIEGRVLLEGDWLAEPVASRPQARRVSYSFIGFEAKIDGEFIGAPIMSSLMHEESASFWRGRLFGRELARYDRESFLRLCDAYGIRWAVTLHERSKRKLDDFGSGVDRLAERGGVAIFRIRAPGSTPRVATRSDGRAIEVTANASGPIVVPYHWNALLSAEPQAELRGSPSDVLPHLSFVEITTSAPGRYRIEFSPWRLVSGDAILPPIL